MPTGNNNPTFKRFGAIAILFWTVLIGTLLGIQIKNENHELINDATNEARDYFRLNLFYRAWASKMGGVYVPTDKVTPNPYLEVPNRDITTSENRQLTLVNPAYMTRMVFEEILAGSHDPVINKITSMKPLNPVNAPDEWEKQSLMAFDRKEYTERSEFTEISGQPYLRFISAFITSDSCLKCHAHQGYKVGDVRGAIVISVPLAKRLELHSQENWETIGSYCLLWLVGSIGIAFASNRRFRYEEKLQQEYALTKIYLETVDTMILSLDSDGRITVINRKACEVLGYHPDELLGRSWFNTCLPQPEGMETIFPVFLKIIAGEFGQFEYHENEVVTKSGELRIIAWHNSLLYDNQGRLSGVISAGGDITERKQIEEVQSYLLQISAGKPDEDFFETLARYLAKTLGMDYVCIDTLHGDGLTASTLAIYHDGKFEVNVEYALKDTPCGEVVGKHICVFPREVCSLFPHDPALQELQAESYLGTTLWSFDMKPIGLIAVIGRKELLDSHFAESVMKLVSIRAAGELERRQAYQEKHLLEQQFQQTQKLESLGVLAGGIAHDFNNILAIIIGYCGLTKMNYESAEKNIPEIEKAAERAAALCRQMLAYAGKATLTESQVNTSMLVDEMVAMLKTTSHKNVVIKPELGTDIPLIKGDASQLRQVVMNLVINAAEAIGDAEGEIDVRLIKAEVKAEQPQKDHLGDVMPAGSYICLEVTDNGCGMNDDTRRKIFEPFYTTKFTGRGLGMSAVLGIIKAHNGALQLESRLGQGTTFKVYLPVQPSSAETEEALQKAVSAAWHGSGTILLAEDEVQVRSIANIILKEMGFNVLEAANGKEALELYQQNSADITLVVTDMGMPVMNGYELFYKLKQLDPHLPIIISSGFGEGDIGSKIPREEIDGMINKPYKFEELREVLKGVVEGRK